MNNGGHVPFSGDSVREELDRVLASHEFRTSKRSQDLLRYVVEHVLNGEAGPLKERTIGIDVFDRPTNYDPNDDAIVRVKAGEVRKRLSLYYSNGGAHNSIRIELPSGTYIPEFHPTSQSAAAPAPQPSAAAAPPPDVTPAPQPVAAATPPPVANPAHRPVATPTPPIAESTRSRHWLPAATVAIVLLAGLLWYFAPPGPTVLDQFWAPVVDGKPPVLVCATFVPVWNLDRRPNATAPAKPEDYVLLPDQFVGAGDLLATSRVTAMLTRTRHPFRLRVGSEASFNDLRSGPAVLIGGSSSRGREIRKEMRYVIDTSGTAAGITDNGKPTEWTLPELPRDRHTAEDYAIISRVFQPDRQAMLVEIAGILQYGTDAASDLVTNPGLMAQALHDAPPGWQKKNLQIVLHVKVIAGAPTLPQVVKTYFW